MNSPSTYPARSAHLADRQRSLLLVVDLQAKLLPAIPNAPLAVWNASRMLQAANCLDVPSLATEQVPEKLGETVPEIRQLVGDTRVKRMFSCRECAPDLQPFQDAGRCQLMICGIETHVCVLQTAIDLLEHWDVSVVVDAVAARHEEDHRTALQRMSAAGAVLTTCESVLFEWCETSADENFKTISRLIRQPPPAS